MALYSSITVSTLSGTNQSKIQDQITLEKAAHIGGFTVLLTGVSRELLTSYNRMLMAGVSSTLTVLKGVAVNLCL